jgi:hypothetical protein
MIHHPPALTFACELECDRLRDLFSRPEVMDFLVSTRSAVALGILDLSSERAAVVRSLNEAGVPVTAWLLLQKEDGYWFNLDNHVQAAARYEQFMAWTRAHHLQWARVGLDIEPDLRSVQLLSRQRLEGVQRLVRHTFNLPRLRRGALAYHELIQRIKKDHYIVETYQFPFIVDERKAQSNLLQRLTGLVDLPEADHEVLMLYSSFMRPWGQGALWSYGRYAQGIGVGSTGGGVELEGTLDTPPLNWAELQVDLLLASQLTDEVFVFSLEGCVEQGFLPLLREMDWQQPMPVPAYEARRVEDMRKLLQRSLWLLARPAWLLFGLALLVSAVSLLRRSKRQ